MTDNDILFKKALKLHNANKHKLAIAAYREVLAQTPNRTDALQNLGAALSSVQAYPAAKLTYEKALRLTTDNASLWSNYGNLLCKLHLYTDASNAHAKAIALEPGNAGNWYNAGNVPFSTNQPDTAITHFDKALSLEPKHAKAHWNRGLSHLQKGEWQAGFSEYEWRLKLYNQILRELPGKKWSGESLNGKRILITTEQGFGDVIQFARFLYPLSEKYDVKIFFECRGALTRLFANLPCLDGVVEKGKPLPDYDYYFPLLSLPHQLNLDGSDFLEIKDYIPIQLESKWSILEQVLKIRNFKGKKIGLIWKGKLTPYDRSCPLELFTPLLNLKEDVQFYSLQYGDDNKALHQLYFSPFVSDIGHCISDFYDTAALMKEMDLVISVDSAPCHLAGALNIPTWVLLLEYSDWRWHLGRSDSPWYPNMKLFRQTSRGDWHGVIDQIKVALDNIT